MVAGEVVDMPITLEDNEAIIERGMASFVEVGEALARIKENRLYADDFDDFEDYVKERWGLERSWAERHIGAAKVALISTTSGLPAPPTIEAAKPLVRLMNEVGQFDRSTMKLRNPRAAEKAVVAAMTKVARAKEGDASPITGRDVARAVNPPAGRGKPGWFELLGTVGEDLLAAQRHMAKAEEAINRTPSADLLAKVEQYAGWADDLATRLRAL